MWTILGGDIAFCQGQGDSTSIMRCSLLSSIMVHLMITLVFRFVCILFVSLAVSGDRNDNVITVAVGVGVGAASYDCHRWLTVSDCFYRGIPNWTPRPAFFSPLFPFKINIPRPSSMFASEKQLIMSIQLGVIMRN